MIIPMLCVTIFVILVVWFLLPRVARLMIHTPTAISIFVCLSMVQLMAVFISMRCTLCGHFLQVALTLILVVGYAIRSEERFSRNAETDLVCRLLLEKKKDSEHEQQHIARRERQGRQRERRENDSTSERRMVGTMSAMEHNSVHV